MRMRHKSPTLVSMWMLDVFCCALGCAVLLWTLESLRASLMTEEAAASQADSDSTRKQLLAVQADLEKTRAELNATIADLRSRTAALTADLDAKEKLLVTANADLANNQTALALATSDLTDAKKRIAAANSNLLTAKDDLARSATRTTDLETEMAKKQQSVTELSARVAALNRADADLRAVIRDREKDRETMTAKAKLAEDRLVNLDAKYQGLVKDTSDAATARAGMAKLQQQVDNANLSIIDLQGERRKLADKIDKLRIETESKFAGVALSGKRVVFVVDISGSMKLVNEKSPDPNKWPGVVDTIGRVMRSIPDMEKYQVIVFSKKAQYLFESAEWRDYKGEASVKEVTDTLIKTPVGGDTNMYDAFDLAFKLRDATLDTLYLFSDGLPTSGVGLTPQQDASFTDTQRTDALSRHVRNTLRTTWNRAVDGKRVKIHSIGFFYESPEVGAFLWALSRENDGSFVGMSKP